MCFFTRQMLIRTSILFILLNGFLLANEQFEQGFKAAQEKKYTEAIRHFEEVLVNEPANSSALYNLGNAYYAEKQFGKALLNYEKAHKLLPGDDDIEQVWLSIALHTTPGVPKHLRPTVALVTAGVEMDVLGMDYAAFSSVQREAVVHAHPRELVPAGTGGGVTASPSGIGVSLFSVISTGTLVSL